MKRNATYIMTKLLDSQGLAKPAQVGVDLTLKDLKRIVGNASIGEKTEQGDTLPCYNYNDGWFQLLPGAYAVTFDQGLKTLDADEHAYIEQRSSLNRNGSRLAGSIYDPGYGCENLGATLYVAVPISIQEHARVAQLLIEMNEPVASDQQYAGQYKGE